jgi:hypothetical protein
MCLTFPQSWELSHSQVGSADAPARKVAVGNYMHHAGRENTTGEPCIVKTADETFRIHSFVVH